MASADAKPVPIKNQAYRVTFPIFDAAGGLVANASALDSEVSLDGAAFVDCANEAAQIPSGSGMYYLDLTAAEMNADTVAVIVKTSTAGAMTTPIVLYPAESMDIPVNVKAISDDAAAADNLESYTDGSSNMLVDSVKISGSTSAADNVEARIGNLDAPVSSRAAPADLSALGGDIDAVKSQTDRLVFAEPGPSDLKATLDGEQVILAPGMHDGAIIPAVTSVNSVTGSVGSVAAPVTVGTNDDKSGYQLADEAIAAAKIAADALVAIQAGLARASDVAALSESVTGDLAALRAATYALTGISDVIGTVYGTGANRKTYIVTDGSTGNPLPGVRVWITSDAGGQFFVAGPQVSDDQGRTFWMLDPGTYYIWRQRPYYTFTNPDTEVVA